MNKWMLCLVLALAARAQDGVAPTAQQGEKDAPKTKTYTDPVFGISMTYPVRLNFRRDPELMRRALAAAARLPELSAEGRDALLAGTAGTQFFLFVTKPAGVFGTNLNVTTEKVPPDPEIKTSADYAAAARRFVRKVVKDPKSAYTPLPVKFGGRTWIRSLTYGTLGGHELLFLTFAHFDPKTRIAYVITITEDARADLKDIAALEQVAKTIRIKAKK